MRTIIFLTAGCLGTSAAFGQNNPPTYNVRQAEKGAQAALSRPVDPDLAARRMAVDSRIITIKPDGSWKVEKEGSFGYHSQAATVMDRGMSGQLKVTQQGTGIKNKEMPRHVGDMAMVTKYLKEAQAFKYVFTEYWGSPEDLEKAQKGDCADKSFWLAAKLIQAGMPGVKVVCGKADGQKMGHAWVEAPIIGEDYILETTSREAPKLRSVYGTKYDTQYPTVGYFDTAGYHFVREPKPAGK